MTQQLTRTGNTKSCDPRTSVTRSLLGYGVIAGPVYIAVALAQALTREGFDLGRHAWSMLANGGPGWIQIANSSSPGWRASPARSACAGPWPRGRARPGLPGSSASTG